MSGRTTDSETETLRKLLHAHTREERLRGMSPERRALYDELLQLRQEIGPVSIDTVKLLREIRADA